MMFKKALRFIVCTALLTTMLTSATIYANNVYIIGYSSVRSGGISYVGTTRYGNQVGQAANIWNSRRAGNSRAPMLVNMINVTGPSQYGTVYVYDQALGTLAPEGAWRQHEILFNTSILNNLSNTSVLSTVAHELGHSIGLNDNTGNSQNIMWYLQNGRTSVGLDDITSYNYLYR